MPCSHAPLLPTPGIMSVFRRTLLLRTVLVAAAFCLGPSAAQAIPCLITHGDTISPIGEAPREVQGEKLPATSVGFKYSSFGVFWMDLWTWGGTYCLYDGKRYWELKPAQAAQLLGKQESDLSTPFLYTFPLGLLILVPVVVLYCGVQLCHKSPPDPVAELLRDERYPKALALFYERAALAEVPPPAAGAAPEGAIQTDVPPPAPPPPDAEAQRQQKIAAAYEAAVVFLTQQGIERAEAEEKLSLLLSATQPAPAPEG
jgi:hypothetical protein